VAVAAANSANTVTSRRSRGRSAGRNRLTSAATITTARNSPSTQSSWSAYARSIRSVITGARAPRDPRDTARRGPGKPLWINRPAGRRAAASAAGGPGAASGGWPGRRRLRRDLGLAHRLVADPLVEEVVAAAPELGGHPDQRHRRGEDRQRPG